MSKINRREFVAGMTAAGAGVCLCGVSSCATFTGKGDTPEIQSGAYLLEDKKVRINLDQAQELAKVGGSVKILDDKLPEPIIIARINNNQFAAVSLKCPHRNVEVEYRAGQQQFQCASIGHSKFNTDGSFVSGPAKKPLKKFNARLGFLDKNKLIIYLD
jgi:Rieske Fe-S protein